MNQGSTKSIPRSTGNLEKQSLYSQQLSNGLQQVSQNEQLNENLQQSSQETKQRQLSAQKEGTQKIINEPLKQNQDQQNEQSQQYNRNIIRQQTNQSQHRKLSGNKKSGGISQSNNQRDNLTRSSIDLSEFNINPTHKKYMSKQNYDNYRPEFFNANEWDNLPNEIEDLEKQTQDEIRRGLTYQRMSSIIRQKTIISNDAHIKAYQSQQQIQSKKDIIALKNQQKYIQNDEKLDKDGRRNTPSINTLQQLNQTIQNIDINQAGILKNNSEFLITDSQRKSFPTEQIPAVKPQQNRSELFQKKGLLKKYITEEVKQVRNDSIIIKNKAQTFDSQNVQINPIANPNQQKLQEIQYSEARIQNETKDQNRVNNGNQDNNDELIEAYNQPDNIEEIVTQISYKEKINIIRRWIFITFEDPQYSRTAKAICIFLQFTIAISCAIFILNTVYLTDETEQNFTDGVNFNHDDPSSSSLSSTSSTTTTTSSDSINQNIYNYAIFQMYGEFIISIIFTVDFLLRIACCGSFGISIKSFLKQAVNMIDLVSIAPFFVGLIFRYTHLKQLNILRVVRLLRIVRIFKLSKYIKGIYILQKALQRSYKQILFVVNLVLIIALFASTIIYYLENHLTNSSLTQKTSNSSQNITSIPQALWFTLVTMTTVGYGDKIPLSIPGKAVAMCIAFIGNSFMIGLPIAVISHDFQAVYKEEKEKEKLKKIKNQNILRYRKQQDRKTSSQVGSQYIGASPVSQTTGIAEPSGFNPVTPKSTENYFPMQQQEQGIQSQTEIQKPRDSIQFAQLPSANSQIQQDLISKIHQQFAQIRVQTQSITNSPMITPQQHQYSQTSQRIEINQNSPEKKQQQTIQQADSQYGISIQQDNQPLPPLTVPSELYEKTKQSPIQQFLENNPKSLKQNQEISNEFQISQRLPLPKSSGNILHEQQNQNMIDEYKIKNRIAENRTSIAQTPNSNNNRQMTDLQDNQIHKNKNVSFYTSNQDDIDQDDEYQAQIEYMANRLKQISRTNKIIRELTIQISKMSYVVTLDIAQLYHTFSQNKSQCKELENYNQDPKDIAYLAQKSEKINSPLLKQRVNQIIAFQRGITKRLSTKISFEHFIQLNQASVSRGGSFATTSQHEIPSKGTTPLHRNQQGAQRPSQYFLQAQNKKKNSFNKIQMKKSHEFDNISLPCNREDEQDIEDFKKSYIQRSLTDLNDGNNTNNNLINGSKTQKNGTKSDFFRRYSELNNITVKGLNQISSLAYQPDEREEDVGSVEGSSSSHSENLEDNIIQEENGQKGTNIQYDLRDYCFSQSQQQVSSIQKSNENQNNLNEFINSVSSLQQNNSANKFKSLPPPVLKQSLSDNSPKKAIDRKLQLYISQEQKTPHFSQQKMKGLFSSQVQTQILNQQQSPSQQKYKNSLIQDSMFKFKSVQQTQNSEYNPQNSIDQSVQNHIKIDLDSNVQSVSDSKQISSYQNQIESVTQFSQNKYNPNRSYRQNENSQGGRKNSQISPKNYSNKSMVDSGIVQNVVGSIEIINPVFSTQIHNFNKKSKREKSNYSSYKEDLYSDEIHENLEKEKENISFSEKENDFSSISHNNIVLGNKKHSQVQNIIQDLILNVSMDLQKQEESQHNNSFNHIEIPKKILRLMSQDYDPIYQIKSKKKSIYYDKNNQIIKPQENNERIKDISSQILKSSQSFSPGNSQNNQSKQISRSKSPQSRRVLNVNQISFNKQQYIQNQILNNPIQTNLSNKLISNYDFSANGSPGQKMNTLISQIRSKNQIQQS